MSEENPTEEAEHIKDLRKQAADGKAAAERNTALERELAFTKAGVDTSSKPAQALLRSYDGELAADAIVAEAKEWNLAPASGDTTPPASTGFDADSPEVQHQQLTSDTQGQPAPTPLPLEKDGVDGALDTFTDNVTKMGRADAEGIAFGDVIRAGMEGKGRARFDPEAWRAEQAKHGHGAEFAG